MLARWFCTIFTLKCLCNYWVLRVKNCKHFCVFVSGNELQQELKAHAFRKCKFETFSGLQQSITPAPLLMAKQEIESTDNLGHFHTRNEIAQTIAKPPVGDVSLDNLLISAEKYAGEITAKNSYPDELTKSEDIAKLGNIVAVVGQAGIGKTTLSKTILLKSIKNEFFNADYVFYLQFRDVVYEEKTHLLSFLTKALTLPWITNETRRNDVLTKLLKNKQILFIMDGLDEAILDTSTTCKPISPYEIALPEIFIKNILQGNLFVRAKKVITSRPRQLLELPDSLRPRFVVNITGLSVESQKQICKDICGDNAEAIFNYIQHNPPISSYCYVPAICILAIHAIDNVRKKQPSGNMSSTLPNTMTEILAIVISLFLKCDHARRALSLERLAELAWEGLKSRKFYFDEEDLKKFSLTVHDLNTLLVTLIAKNSKNSDMGLLGGDLEKLSYFAHLIIQEFLAAMKLIFFTTSAEFQELFLGKSVGPIQFRKPQQNLSGSTWEMVTKFLFGLLNAKTSNFLTRQFPSLPSDVSPVSKKLCNFALNTFAKLKKHSSDSNYIQEVLRICSWAYELGDKNFASKIAKSLKPELTIIGKFLPSDIAPLFFILDQRKSPLRLKATPFDTWFVGDSLDLVFEIMENKQAGRQILASFQTLKLFFTRSGSKYASHTIL